MSVESNTMPVRAQTQFLPRPGAGSFKRLLGRASSRVSVRAPGTSALMYAKCESGGRRSRPVEASRGYLQRDTASVADPSALSTADRETAGVRVATTLA